MKVKTLFTKVTYIAAMLLTFSSVNAASSNGFAQRCVLGSSCTIPANDGGLTYYYITPSDGTHYTCVVHSKTGKLRVAVYGGKDFFISKLDGLFFTADPTVSIDIKGSFKHPDDLKDAGQIKFDKLSGSKGTVTCSVNQS